MAVRASGIATVARLALAQSAVSGPTAAVAGFGVAAVFPVANVWLAGASGAACLALAAALGVGAVTPVPDAMPALQVERLPVRHQFAVAFARAGVVLVAAWAGAALAQALGL